MVLDFLGLVELPVKCRSERQREEFLREEWALDSVPSPHRAQCRFGELHNLDV